MAGLGDLIVVVEDLATYQAAVNAGKTAPSVMYLILAERQVYFNSELWSKAPEEGGGVDVSTVVTKSELEEVEEVTAAALIDLNTRKADVTFVEEAIATAVTNALNTAV